MNLFWIVYLKTVNPNLNFNSPFFFKNIFKNVWPQEKRPTRSTSVQCDPVVEPKPKSPEPTPQTQPQPQPQQPKQLIRQPAECPSDTSDTIDLTQSTQYASECAASSSDSSGSASASDSASRLEEGDESYLSEGVLIYGLRDEDVIFL